MPSSITHQLIADEALPALPPEAARAAERNYDYYFLGAQGPDVFFFYRPLSKSEPNLGKFLHREHVFDVFTLFSCYLKTLAGEEKERITAYVAGYISHYCADTAFHPFVYNYLNENKADRFVHQQMENDWDVYFLQSLRGKSAERYVFPFSPKKLSREGALFRLYQYLARKLGRKELNRKSFRRALSGFEKYLKFFHKKSYASQKRWEKAEMFFRAKNRLSCLYPRSRSNPEFLSGEHYFRLSEERGKDADELFRLSARESARLCAVFFSERAENFLPRKDFSRHFLTGKQLQP